MPTDDQMNDYMWGQIGGQPGSLYGQMGEQHAKALKPASMTTTSTPHATQSTGRIFGRSIRYRKPRDPDLAFAEFLSFLTLIATSFILYRASLGLSIWINIAIVIGVTYSVRFIFRRYRKLTRIARYGTYAGIALGLVYIVTLAA